MKCHFPIPNVESNLLYQPRSVLLQSSRDYATIEKLRVQNELLKRQLNSLMGTQGRTNHFVGRPVANTQNTVLNSEDEVQLSYQNKMSKLKSRKSSKKSLSHNGTTPNSPRLCRQLKEENLNFSNSQRLPFVPNVRKENEVLKVMIIQQDKGGKYFRDRQSQQKYHHNRLSKTQDTQFMQPNQFQFPSNRLNFTSDNFRGTSRERVHKKSDSFNQTEYSRINELETARIFPRYNLPLANEPFRQSSTHKNMVFFDQKATRSMKTDPSNSQKGLKTNNVMRQVKFKQNVRPKLASPRGNAYIDRIQAEQRGVKVSESQIQSLEDSNLSIEQQLAHKKKCRKLKYDIYMCDQIEH